MDLAKDDVVVVTGSSGLIGYPVCERLAKSCRVVGLDRPGVPHPPPEAERIDVDLSSDEDTKKAFDQILSKYGQRITSVVHLAAYYDFSGRPSDKYNQI